MNKAEDMNLIKTYFRRLISKEVRLFEFGVNDCRFDVINIDPFKQIIRGHEIKISRADFLQDRRAGKWKKYLEYCDRFYWVCRPGIIKKEEVEDPAGLMWISTYKERYPEVQYYSSGFPISRLIKRAEKNTVETDTRMYVLALLLSRAKYRGEEFF